MDVSAIRRVSRTLVGLAVFTGLAVQSLAQAPAANAPRALNASDYARAEKFLGYSVNPLVLHGAVRATWLPGDRFWYRDTVENGAEFVLVDPAKGTKAPAFDHAKLAATLAVASKATCDATHLPFSQFEFTPDGQSITFTVQSVKWSCDVQGRSCSSSRTAADTSGAAASRREERKSPDGKWAVFIRNDNLWVRDTATGAEKALTTDGVRDFGYATDNAGWARSDAPVVLWSPDSTKIATYQQDQRGVGEMYVVETKVGHPTLQAWKYPLPGDEKVTTIQRVIIHLDGPKVVRLKMPPDQHRSTVTDDIKSASGELEDAQWSGDSSRLAFVSTSRDHKREQVRIANAVTGDVRDVFEESVSTYYESGLDKANWRVLFDTNEVIWFSERDNWGHLYLYDLQTGRVKHAITSGEGNVAQVLRVDEKARVIHFVGVGREKGRDPYFRHYYRIGFDGKNLALLTPEDADHDISVSPSGALFIDNYSRPDVPPVSVLKAADGKLALALQKADISRLVAAGWKPPIPITVKGRDGVTDLYGLLFKPTNFDPDRKYPIINSIYPGPQTGSVGGRSFSAARGDAQALTELGFLVVQIDGMGTPWRSKKFHDAYYGDMGDNTLPDQVAGMNDLARRYPWIDIDRAGIYGHSGGGFATADAMFRYPDFFKVGVSQAGNHDNRGYEDDWGEKWQGLLERRSEGTDSYDSQANQNFAKNLKGKLLIAHGTMDDNVPPYNTLLVVNELVKANKDFDLLLFPNRKHGFGSEPYMMRRRWDYFVRHLMGAEPPKEFEFHPPAQGQRR
ncbi:MAG TPA: DPP IV N-terminal domain-containing protein [Vicinamibacterales bacterium]|jgi:dienelactone hydrolase